MSSIIAGIIGAVVALVTAHFTRYAEVTTQSRIDWIQRVREIAIEFIDSVKINNYTKSNELFIKLKVYLNPCNNIDNDIIDTARNCLYNLNNVDEFSNMIQAYLKTEWERAKYESKGKKFSSYMFAKKYYRYLEEINFKMDKNNNTDIYKSKLKRIEKFERFTYCFTGVCNWFIKLVTTVISILAVIIIIYIIVHNPYSDLIKYLGI